MMQPAEPWHGNNPMTSTGILFYLTSSGCSFAQHKMSPVIVVVMDVLVHQAFQMTLIVDDHMIEQVAAATPDPPLRNAVLPRASEAGSFWLNAQGLDGSDDLLIEVRGSIEDQILRGRIVGKCFAQLLRNPHAARMAGEAPTQDASPVMRNDEEAVQHTKSQRRYGEEIHCGNRFPMIAQKGRPSLCRFRTPRRSSHPAQDRSFRNIEAKHDQLTVDTRSTPGSVLSNHAEDEFSQLRADLFTAWATSVPREPCPIQLEHNPVPSHYSLRLYQDQRLLPS